MSFIGDDEDIIYPSDMQPGSLMHLRTADDDIQQMIDKFKSNIENEMNMKYSNIKAINYRSRVVNGSTYYINVEATTALIPIKAVPPQKFTVTIYHNAITGANSVSVSNVY